MASDYETSQTFPLYTSPSQLAPASAPSHVYGFDLLTEDGSLFTWCESRAEAEERQEWERTIMGRTLTLVDARIN